MLLYLLDMRQIAGNANSRNEFFNCTKGCFYYRSNQISNTNLVVTFNNEIDFFVQLQNSFPKLKEGTLTKLH